MFRLVLLWVQRISARGGVLHIQIENDRVLLKGKAITVMEGQWLA